MARLVPTDASGGEEGVPDELSLDGWDEVDFRKYFNDEQQVPDEDWEMLMQDVRLLLSSSSTDQIEGCMGVLRKLEDEGFWNPPHSNAGIGSQTSFLEVLVRRTIMPLKELELASTDQSVQRHVQIVLNGVEAAMPSPQWEESLEDDNTRHFYVHDGLWNGQMTHLQHMKARELKRRKDAQRRLRLWWWDWGPMLLVGSPMLFGIALVPWLAVLVSSVNESVSIANISVVTALSIVMAVSTTTTRVMVFRIPAWQRRRRERAALQEASALGAAEAGLAGGDGRLRANVSQQWAEGVPSFKPESIKSALATFLLMVVFTLGLLLVLPVCSGTALVACNSRALESAVPSALIGRAYLFPRVALLLHLVVLAINIHTVDQWVPVSLRPSLPHPACSRVYIPSMTRLLRYGVCSCRCFKTAYRRDTLGTERLKADIAAMKRRLRRLKQSPKSAVGAPRTRSLGPRIATAEQRERKRHQRFVEMAKDAQSMRSLLVLHERSLHERGAKNFAHGPALHLDVGVGGASSKGNSDPPMAKKLSMHLKHLVSPGTMMLRERPSGQIIERYGSSTYERDSTYV